MFSQLARLLHLTPFAPATAAPAGRAAVRAAEPSVDRSPVEAEEPFVCAEFSIMSRRHERGGREIGWFVDVKNLDWDAVFAIPRRPNDNYEETAFRQIAALSGWRLTNVVPTGERGHWLYFERGQDIV